jgi:hypothetical protein
MAASAVDFGKPLALGDLGGIILRQHRACGENECDKDENQSHVSDFTRT